MNWKAATMKQLALANQWRESSRIWRALTFAMALAMVLSCCWRAWGTVPVRSPMLRDHCATIEINYLYDENGK